MDASVSAVDLAAQPDLWQHRARHVEQAQHLVVPAAYGCSRAASARRWSHPSREPCRRSADRSGTCRWCRTRVRRARRVRAPRHMVEQPAHLVAGEIRVEDQTGLRDSGLMASRLQRSQSAVRRSCQTIAGWIGLPVFRSQSTGLALIRDADRGDSPRAMTLLRAALGPSRDDALPDLLRVMLDPFRAPERCCGELLLRRRQRCRARPIEDDRARSRSCPDRRRECAMRPSSTPAWSAGIIPGGRRQWACSSAAIFPDYCSYLGLNNCFRIGEARRPAKEVDLAPFRSRKRMPVGKRFSARARRIREIGKFTEAAARASLGLTPDSPGVGHCLLAPRRRRPSVRRRLAAAPAPTPAASRRGRQQVVDQRPDLVEVELGAGVRVHHRGVIDVLAVLGHQRRDRQLLHVDVGADQRRQLRRQGADMRSAGCRCGRRGTAPRPRSRRAAT